MKILLSAALLLAATLPLNGDFHRRIDVIESFTIAYPEVPTILVPVSFVGQAPSAVYSTNGTKATEFAAPQDYVNIAQIYIVVVPVKLSNIEPVFCPVADCYKRTRFRR